MNAEEARKLSEEFKFTTEMGECIELVRIAANRGEFSIYRDYLEQTTQEYLKKQGYQVKWHDVQRDGYWKISW
jgi:hypothetical protein